MKKSMAFQNFFDSFRITIKETNDKLYIKVYSLTDNKKTALFGLFLNKDISANHILAAAKIGEMNWRNGNMPKYRLETSSFLPSGLTSPIKFHFFIDRFEQVVNKRTLKPYRGKKMAIFAIDSLSEAQAYLDVINIDYSLTTN